MSRNQRIGLVVVALLVAVAAFVLARPGAEEDSPEQAAQTTPAETEPQTAEEATESAPTAKPKPKPEVTRIQISGGAPVGGVRRVAAEKGDTVRIVVTADAPDDIHLHGYDIERQAGPGQPARFAFRADIEGIFEIESHVAEDAGKDPLVARLVVQPS